MFKAVLLDAGGVLLDESAMEQRVAELIVQTLNQVRPDYSLDQYWKDIQEAVDRFAPKAYAYVIWKYCDGDKSLFDKLHRDFHRRDNEAAIPMLPMPGIEKELHELGKRYALVAAGQYGARLYKVLDQIGVSGLFANRLSQDDFSITKPDPRYLIMLAEQAGFKPSECIMVGDRIDNDVIPAKQAGMGTVLVRTGIHRNQRSRLPHELPDIEQPTTNGLAMAIINCFGLR